MLVKWVQLKDNDLSPETSGQYSSLLASQLVDQEVALRKFWC
jgi:hypothetical protein